MAQAKTITFGKQMMLLGDGATPTEVFAAPCGFDSLTMTINIETSDSNVLDCADPDLPAWLISDEVSKQMTLQGSGILDISAQKIWREWSTEGGEKNVRWVKNTTSAEGGGHYQAPAILSSYEEQGERGQRWKISVGLKLQGKPVWTDAV